MRTVSSQGAASAQVQARWEEADRALRVPCGPTLAAAAGSRGVIMRWIAWCVLAVACSGSTSGDPGPGYDESWGERRARRRQGRRYLRHCRSQFRSRSEGRGTSGGQRRWLLLHRLEGSRFARSDDEGSEWRSSRRLLYRGLSHHVSSESWSHDGTVLIKKYKIAESARHYLVARPYQNSRRWRLRPLTQVSRGAMCR